MKIARRDMLRNSAFGVIAATPGGSAPATSANRYPRGDGVISLAEIGARGDGTTDDTAALREALERCIETGATLYVPAGSYRHRTIRLAPKGRAGLRIVGEWAFDVEQAVRGSFLVHDGAGPGLEVGGDGGPFPLDVEGICFLGNPTSEAGVRIIGRSSLHFRRCGWIRHGNRAGTGALHLTRTSQEFVGLLSLQHCWFAYGAKGIVIDKPLTNVIHVDSSTFLDMDRCIIVQNNASCRSIAIRDCHFENGKSLESVLSVDGSVYSLNFTGNYVEQNSSTIDNPIIDIDRTKEGEISRGILIEGNFFQKVLNRRNTAIIRANEVNGMIIRSNVVSAGNARDRYWCWLGAAVANAAVDLPSSPNGVAAYPIFSARTGQAYDHALNSDQLPSATGRPILR